MNIGIVSVITVLVLVIASSFSVIIVKHINRSSFIELQDLLKNRDELHIEWARLQLGYGSFGSQGRIEHFAKNQLQMNLPDFEQVRVVVIYE